jgi:hypothetical protein
MTAMQDIDNIMWDFFALVYINFIVMLAYYSIQNLEYNNKVAHAISAT